MRIAASPNASLMQHFQQPSPRESPVVQRGANARRNGQWERQRKLPCCKTFCETSYLLLYLLISKCSPDFSVIFLFVWLKVIVAFPCQFPVFFPSPLLVFPLSDFFPQTHPCANWKGRRRTDHSHTCALHLPQVKIGTNSSRKTLPRKCRLCIKKR